MKYTYYNPDSGQIIGVIDTTDPDLAQLHLADKTWIQGEYNFDRYYISDGQPVPMPTRPYDNAEYDFDWITHTWQLNTQKMSDRIRSDRNRELASVDRVNAVWYATLTSEQQAQLAQYRLDLLAVPQQSNFPNQVNWPSKPAWL
jgi:hypothetical protein